jgi:hypothetical protein
MMDRLNHPGSFGFGVKLIALAIFATLLGATISSGQAPTPLLESKMSIRVTNQRMEEVLRQIAAKGSFNFSYSPDAIDVKSRVSINATNQSVREILNVLFDGTVTFKERLKYIILVKAPPTAEKETSSFYLNGYIVDELTGERLPDVSIYEPVTLASAVSNKFGYYKITLPALPDQLKLEVRKSAYTGRTIKINSRKNSYYSISLVPDTLRPIPSPEPKMTTRRDSIQPKVEIPVIVVSRQPEPDSIVPLQRKERKPEPLSESLKYIRDGLVYAFSSARQLIHTSNISDTLYRPFQASILPFIGTNQQLSGNVINDISLNLFAGYSLGVNALELGGGLNVVRLDVYGVQAAGLANAVGRNVSGVQLAGGLNLVIENVDGVQASGGFNVNGKDFDGGQFSGMANVVGRDVRGIQISGGVNVAGRTLYGWQMAGILNYAHKVNRGHQLGIINIADSTNTTPIGYFSYVKFNGYRRLEFTTDDFNYGNITFKTGVKKFYNIFTLGTSGFINGKPIGSLGYGIGTARSLGRGWMLNADLVLNRVAIQKRFWQQPQADHLRLVVALEKKLSNRLALSVGPTLNFFNSPYRGLLEGTGSRRNPLWIGGVPNASQSNYGWIGFQAGLRICNR